MRFPAGLVLSRVQSFIRCGSRAANGPFSATRDIASASAPKAARKRLLKVERSPKPRRARRRCTGRRDEASASAARRIRALSRYDSGVMPVSLPEDAQEMILAHPCARRHRPLARAAAPRRTRPGGSPRPPGAPRARSARLSERADAGHRGDDALDELATPVPRERSDRGWSRHSASICAMTGSAFGDGGRLGAEKRKRLVDAAAAAISPNSSS